MKYVMIGKDWEYMLSEETSLEECIDWAKKGIFHEMAGGAVKYLAVDPNHGENYQEVYVEGSGYAYINADNGGIFV